MGTVGTGDGCETTGVVDSLCCKGWFGDRWVPFHVNLEGSTGSHRPGQLWFLSTYSLCIT